MKKRLVITMAMVLVFALLAIGCGKTETTEPTTEESEVVSTTEPTTFEVPEIKDEPTTEPTTEETTEASAPETTKKNTSNNSSGSSSGSSSSSNKDSNSSSSNNSSISVTGERTTNEDGLKGYYISDKIFFVDDESVTGGHGDANDGMDWDEDGDIDADDKEFEENISWELE